MANLTVEDYLQALIALAPKGDAWPLDEGDSTLRDLLYGLAEEWARLDARTQALLNEADPRTTTECIDDWERVLELPDNCGIAPDSLQKRRAAAAAKYGAIGGQTIDYFIQLAAIFGFTITIEEYRGFRAGAGRCGESLAPADVIFYWKITAPLETISHFRPGASTAGDPLVGFGNDALECLINKYKPAHTEPIFAYVEV